MTDEPTNGVEVVVVSQPYHDGRYIISYKGGSLNGLSYPSAEAAQADLDSIRAALATPAASPAAEPVDIATNFFSMTRRELHEALAATPSPAPTAVGWRDDPSADERWNAGCDFAMTQLCHFLGVDPATVDWDAATETLDGDVQSVIGKILRAKLGEDWGPDAPAPAAVEELMGTAADAIRHLQSELAEAQSKIAHLAKQEIDIRTAYQTVRAENLHLARENKRLDREWEAARAALSTLAAEVESMKSDREYVIGFNAGWGEAMHRAALSTPPAEKEG